MNSATLGQIAKLEAILEEIKSVKSSISKEEQSALMFYSGGGTQTNNIDSGSGQQINNNTHIGTQYF